MAKAKGASKPAVDPFAAAKPQAATVAKKDDTIFTPEVMAANQTIYNRDQIITAANDFAEGHAQETAGKNKKGAARPIVTTAALYSYARAWVENGARPEHSPKLVVPTRKDDGSFSLVNDMGITFIVQDSVTKLDENRFAVLANTIGPQAAEEHTTRGNTFSLNSETLDETINIDGQDQTVMDAVKAALMEKFRDHGDVLARLMTVKPVWTTNKGLIDLGLKLVTQGKRDLAAVSRLVEFVENGQFTIQLKTGTAAK